MDYVKGGKKSKIFIRALALSVLVASSLVVGFAVAQQFEPVSPERAVREEGLSKGITVQPNGGIRAEEFLKLVYECTRPIATEVLAGGRRLLRVYEFETVSEQMYRLQGVRAISTAVRRAEVKARSSAVRILNGIKQYSLEVSGSVDTQRTGAQESSTRSGEVAGTAFAQSETLDFYSRLDVSQAEGFLKGAVVSGTKIISLGQGGLCVMVRLDVPLATGQGGSSPPSSFPGGSSGGQGSSSPFNPGGAPPLPPGGVGDW
jgi:hypothetical protein